MIIGAGFAGLSAAYFLLKENAGSVCLVEQEAQPGLAASGQSASMIHQLVSDPLLCRLGLESVRLLKEDWLKAFPEVSFSQCGSLHIGRASDLKSNDTALTLAKEYTVEAQRLNRDEAVAKCPLLQNTDFEEAVWCPSDGIIDASALIHRLLKFCRDHGAHFVSSLPGQLSVKDGPLYEIDGGEQGILSARTVINAAGAWAGRVGAMVRAQSFPVSAMRRHIFVTTPLPLSHENTPFVWDVTHEIYFRPMGASLLISPCDEEGCEPGPTPVNEEIKVLLEQKLKTFLPQLVDVHYDDAWSGLRTFAEDRRPVIGWDQDIKNFFWAACLGGHGITGAAGVGRLAASLILGQPVSPVLREGLSPKRFVK